VPNERYQIQYTIRISQYNGKKLNPPVFFYDATGIIENTRSNRARDLIRKLAFSMSMGRTIEAEKLRKVFEQVYLPAPIEYEVVIAKYNPMTRLQTDQYETIKVLGKFKKTK
jgi:hypothetical protein